MENRTERLVYTRKEASNVLGVGLVTLDALLRREKDPLPHVKVGSRILIPINALETWITNNTNH